MPSAATAKNPHRRPDCQTPDHKDSSEWNWQEWLWSNEELLVHFTPLAHMQKIAFPKTPDLNDEPCGEDGANMQLVMEGTRAASNGFC